MLQTLFVPLWSVAKAEARDINLYHSQWLNNDRSSQASFNYRLWSGPNKTPIIAINVRFVNLNCCFHLWKSYDYYSFHCDASCLYFEQTFTQLHFPIHLKNVDDKAVFETCQFFVNAVLLLASWQRPYKVCLSYNYNLWSEQNT